MLLLSSERILRRPVTFLVMGDPSDTVEVQVIFLLAIQQQDKQAEMPSQVVELVQDEAFLEGLAAASSGGQAYELIRHRLGTGSGCR